MNATKANIEPELSRADISNPVRVCLMLDQLRRGGTEMRIRRLINNFDRSKVEPFLCLLDGTSDDSKLLEPDCAVLRLGVKSILRFSTLSRLMELYRFLKDNRISVLELYFRDSNAVGIPVARLAGTKCVTTFFNQGYWVKWFDRLMYLVYRPFISKMITNCEMAAVAGQRLAFIPASKCAVLHNGIELERLLEIPIRDLPQDKTCSIGMVANLRGVKNPQLLIRAAAMLRSRGFPLTFSIAGQGPLRESLEESISDHDLQDCFELLGVVDDVADYLANLDIAVLCSDSEGMSNALMEYMAAGRAIVATNVGGNPELIQHEQTGLLIEEDNPNDLANSIERLVEDPELRLALSRRARENAGQHYSCAAMVQRYESFYTDCFSETVHGREKRVNGCK